MKRWILIAALVMPCALTAQEAFYKQIHYRDNDPFLFCTKGMKIWDPCWIPIPPYTGQWMYTGICRPPNKYGRSWTQDDRQALDELEEICPAAQQSGGWDGRGGRSDKTPYSH